MSEPRIVCRFSCGAASAVATKLMLAQFDRDRIVITYSDPGSEHPDNAASIRSVEKQGRTVIGHFYKYELEGNP